MEKWKCLFSFFLSSFFNTKNILYWKVGEQQRDSAMHIHVLILPKTLLPSRLVHNIEQSSMYHTIGWLSRDLGKIMYTMLYLKWITKF